MIVERISGRRVHLDSGRTYHVKYNPPINEGKDNETGEPLTTRKDDMPETVKDRLKVYWNQTEPLIKFYREKESQSQLRYLSTDGTDEVEIIKTNILNFLNP